MASNRPQRLRDSNDPEPGAVDPPVTNVALIREGIEGSWTIQLRSGGPIGGIAYQYAENRPFGGDVSSLEQPGTRLARRLYASLLPGNAVRMWEAVISDPHPQVRGRAASQLRADLASPGVTAALSAVLTVETDPLVRTMIETALNPTVPAPFVLPVSPETGRATR